MLAGDLAVMRSPAEHILDLSDAATVLAKDNDSDPVLFRVSELVPEAPGIVRAQVRGQLVEVLLTVYRNGSARARSKKSIWENTNSDSI